MPKMKRKTHLCMIDRGRMIDVTGKGEHLKCKRCGRLVMKIGKSRYI